MMKSSIRRRVLLLALLPATLLALSLGYFFTLSRITDLDQALRARGLAIARHLAPACEYGVFSGNNQILQRLADSALAEPDVISVYIMDRGGNVLASNSLKQSKLAGIQPGDIPVSSQNNIVTVATRSNVLFFRMPIRQTEVQVDDFALTSTPSPVIQPVNAAPLGYVAIELSRKATMERQNEVLRSAALLTIAALIATALLALRLGREITVPIMKLASAVDKIGRGYLDVRVKLGGNDDEFRILEDGINGMVSKLHRAHDNLQEQILQATAKLSYQASHDMLTGLINRREFEVRLKRALFSAQHQDREHALCYMDLDQFKIVNDSCGHVAGDELLRQLTLHLQQEVRERDTLARLGGDEFGLLLENCPQDKALELAEIMRKTVEDFRFSVGEKNFMVGVSIGIVMINHESDNVVSLLTSADAACYAAKDHGRNRVHLYQMQDSELAQRRGEMQWVNRIQQAIAENRLQLYFQQIQPLQKQEQGLHVELLLRMIDESGQCILPMAFIPAAERYHLMPMLDRWVMENSFRLCEAYVAPDGCELQTWAVNVSGASLCDAGFVQYLKSHLVDNPALAQTLCIEITETAAITNLGAANTFIQELKLLGCRFALDDFGSGLSSLNYLKNLNVDYLKIDGAFIKDMADDAIDLAMVEAINKIGHQMGLLTIAEFVDSERVLLKLKEIGVDFVQGNWIHKPENAEALCKA
ncbi:EAL domain-containing protein [Sulfuriferula sp. GW1]|uniref:EAL domain-containing protein n=1 Tax=Sulfuriferula sp. GW1 TaxID=3345111 RepID=UPI0039AF4B33